ncbi:MAG: hypothetical protein QN183_12240 [Armatimonadota bacterium]|nr:hypothetical protein [Armatimonadota bacterium]MDR7485245.1 hypothetical protein [Armatimonadota bacterium]MDR7534205.1 hypothetical protein [Armatimonadota bacterium]MDR7537120.1 hypothetical protein [Armatimonadota bacterium]
MRHHSRPPAGCAAPPAGRPAGLTLLEVVLALGLAALAAAAWTGVLVAVLRSGVALEHRLDAQYHARRALERITEEARWAEAVVADPGCPPAGLCADRLTLRVPAGNPYRGLEAYEVRFQHNAPRQEVERRVGGGTNNLAGAIAGLTVTYLDADGLPAGEPATVTRVRVALTAARRGAPPLVAESDVLLRNRRPPPSPAPTPIGPRPSPRAPGAPLDADRWTPPGAPRPVQPR